MLKDEIWQDPASTQALHFNENKHTLSCTKGSTYPILENGIIDFLPNVSKSNVKGTSKLARRFSNGLKGDEKIRSSYLQFLEIWPADYVLEVSTGNCANMKYLQTKAHYIGTDSNMEALQKGLKTITDYDLNITLCHAQAEALPFIDNLFGCVFHDGNETPFTDIDKAVKEMLRVTKPGGKIVIMSKDKDDSAIVSALGDQVRDMKRVDVNKDKYHVVACFKK